MNDQELLIEKLNMIQKETVRIRRLFGVSIIILALLLMVLAPSIIRLSSLVSPKISDTGIDMHMMNDKESMRAQTMQEGVPGQMSSSTTPSAARVGSSTPTTP